MGPWEEWWGLSAGAPSLQKTGETGPKTNTHEA